MKERLKELRKRPELGELIDILIDQCEDDFEANLRAHLERHDQVLCSASELRKMVLDAGRVVVDESDRLGWVIYTPDPGVGG